MIIRVMISNANIALLGTLWFYFDWENVALFSGLSGDVSTQLLRIIDREIWLTAFTANQKLQCIAGHLPVFGVTEKQGKVGKLFLLLVFKREYKTQMLVVSISIYN